MNITGAEVIARALVANGITQIFNVPGFGIHPLIDAIKRQGDALDYKCGPSETAVGLMADGYGRATGKPAFVNVYHASGTALAMMGVTTAWADCSPMIFTTTTTSRRLERDDGYAAVPRDITETTRQFTKWDWEVPSIDRIPEAIARAVVMATTAPMGPVHLAFPMDLYTEEISEDAWSRLRLHDTQRLRLYSQTVADPAGIAAAAAMLAAAKRPLIVAGGDVAQYDAVDELVRIADATGAAVLGEPYVAYMGFPNTHAGYAGRYSGSHALVKEADVILVAGAELTAGSGASLVPPTSARVIHLTTTALNIGKQVWADVGLVGHPATSLPALADAVAALPAPSTSEWRERCNAYVGAFRSRLSEHLASPSQPDGPTRLPTLIRSIGATFGDDAIIVDHSTTGTAYVLEMAPFPQPRRYFGISARASAQGWGTPASIGIQLGSPGRRVVAIVGDGGFMFTSTTLYSAAQWRTPVVVIVLSNGGWHDVAYGARKNRGWSDQDVRDFGWGADPAIDYAGLARSLGIRSYRAANEAELDAALAGARDGEGPALVEVVSDPDTTRYYLSFIAA